MRMAFLSPALKLSTRAAEQEIEKRGSQGARRRCKPARSVYIRLAYSIPFI